MKSCCSFPKLRYLQKIPFYFLIFTFYILCHTLSSTILCSIYLTICTIVYLTNAQQIAVVNTVDDEGRTLEVNNKLTVSYTLVLLYCHTIVGLLYSTVQ